MLLSDVVDASRAVAATRSRKAKVSVLAEVLARSEESEVAIVAAYLSGTLRQRRTGLGWRGLTALPPPAEAPSLTVREVDAAFAAIAEVAGAGSRALRSALTERLFGAATAEEQDWLRRVAVGEVRQGALDALLQEAVAAASGIPVAEVRRAAMLTGSTTATAVLALTEGREAVAAVTMQVGTPLSPMLASSAPDVAAALVKASGGPSDPVAVETKLDGIRVQVHRDGEVVRIFTRSLDEITSRLPEVVEVVAALPAARVVLDGEALVVDADGRPSPFQDTASRTATHVAHTARVTPYFFDLLHLDGADLLDLPAHERWRRLGDLVPDEHLVRRVVTADPDEAAAFLADTLAQRHEGVLVKALGTPYEAGRRGSAWVKVKPVHTLDLVVLAVEWGSGRRQGMLSNIHLGARSGDDLVMVGKTFKGMTDEMLAWQTERFLALATHREGHVVHVRPEQVVEIALDGAQRSTRYPGGVALRFARVVRYRDDKSPADADTVETVRSHLA